MRAFLGCKIILAEPMTVGEFKNKHPERALDAGLGVDGTRQGYLVQYPDGYQSWSPKAVFEEAYRPVSDSEHGLILLDVD